jgi:uncharacterized protein
MYRWSMVILGPTEVTPLHLSAGWPYRDLDVAALRAAGVRPVPLREFIFKITSRCNLACDHCYLYSGPDESWRMQPRLMSIATAQRAAQRIAEHAIAHGLAEVRVVLHGGEPLLAGPVQVSALVKAIRDQLPVGVACDIRIQTNAIQLDSAWLDVMHKERIRVGVSLDGDEAAHNLHRAQPSST